MNQNLVQRLFGNHRNLGIGSGKATVWTCDLTHDYIAINADYRS